MGSAIRGSFALKVSTSHDFGALKVVTNRGSAALKLLTNIGPVEVDVLTNRGSGALGAYKSWIRCT